MNNPFEMVVAIVLIVTVARVFTRRGDPRGLFGRTAAAPADAVPSTELVRLRAEVDQLSRRVQTLERLATDPAAKLADDIERLRDQRH